MNLDAAHLDEIREDIAYQYKNGVTNYALFCMTLVPEGNPPVNKAAKMPDVSGSVKELAFEVRDGKYIIDTPAYTLNPVVLLAY